MSAAGLPGLDTRTSWSQATASAELGAKLTRVQRSSAENMQFLRKFSRNSESYWQARRSELSRYITRRWKPWCAGIVDRVSFQALMLVFTVYALFGDDFRLSLTSGWRADLVFDVFTTVALFLFTFELVISSIGKADYFLSFFFWLDLIATLSLLLDITVIYDQFVNLTQAGEDSDLARTGRASRVGTRAGRVIRVIRVIRLVRIIKLWRTAVNLRKRLSAHKDHLDSPGFGIEDEEYRESRVGQKLSLLTTQKVILLILFMLVVLPFISLDGFHKDLPTSAVYGADVVQRAFSQCRGGAGATSTGAPRPNLTLSCDTFYRKLTMYIGYHHTLNDACKGGWSQSFSSTCRLDLGWIGFHTDTAFGGFGETSIAERWSELFGSGPAATGFHGPSVREKLDEGLMRDCEAGAGHWRYTSLMEDSRLSCPGDLRQSEVTTIFPTLVELDSEPDVIFVFDLRPWIRRSAVFNVMQTLFICVILLIGALAFSHDANVLVLQPIERMINKVERIRDNPLFAMKLGDETYRQQREQDSQSESPEKPRPWARFLTWCRRRRQNKVQTLETKILENAIIKLGTLLALGFGEAGSEIIGKNMGDDSATVNAMIAGSKVQAVFGFCNIRNFTDTTEVLQDKVVVFVNQVAEIVHSIVDTWHGAANRNIGDAFLIVWRLNEDFKHWQRSRHGDMSVISLVQIIAAINKSAALQDYREHPALLARLPGYRVRMSFGLHCGWAIEGAIGSVFKIDASYLSPHVNIACQLEAVTKLYGVLILMSDPLAELCSSMMFKYFRAVDHVLLKGGTSTPMRLHTIDVNGGILATEHIAQVKSRNQFELRREREEAKEQKVQRKFNVPHLFETDPDLRRMREAFPARFFSGFGKGMLNYEAGEWGVARKELELTRDMLWGPEAPDGPSKILLDFMAQHDFDPSKASPPKGCPGSGWPGFRELAQA